MYGKKVMMAPAKTGGKKAPFKPCPGCPNPAGCKAKGMCAKKAMAKK